MVLKLTGIILIAGILGFGCRENSDIVLSEEIIEENEGISWNHNDFEAGLNQAAEEEKYLMVNFHADWCGWCQRMDSDTFADPEVVGFADNFVNVKIDTQEDQRVAQQYNVRGLPTTVFLDYDGGVVENVSGYRESEDFLEIMEGVLQGSQ